MFLNILMISVLYVLKMFLKEYSSGPSNFSEIFYFYFILFYLVCHRYNNLKNKKGKKRQKKIYTV